MSSSGIGGGRGGGGGVGRAGGCAGIDCGDLRATSGVGMGDGMGTGLGGGVGAGCGWTGGVGELSGDDGCEGTSINRTVIGCSCALPAITSSGGFIFVSVKSATCAAIDITSAMENRR
jgi:hypothetical protein